MAYTSDRRGRNLTDLLQNFLCHWKKKKGIAVCSSSLVLCSVHGRMAGFCTQSCYPKNFIAEGPNILYLCILEVSVQQDFSHCYKTHKVRCVSSVLQAELFSFFSTLIERMLFSCFHSSVSETLVVLWNLPCPATAIANCEFCGLSSNIKVIPLP